MSAANNSSIQRREFRWARAATGGEVRSIIFVQSTTVRTRRTSRCVSALDWENRTRRMLHPQIDPIATTRARRMRSRRREQSVNLFAIFPGSGRRRKALPLENSEALAVSSEPRTFIILGPRGIREERRSANAMCRYLKFRFGTVGIARLAEGASSAHDRGVSHIAAGQRDADGSGYIRSN